MTDPLVIPTPAGTFDALAAGPDDGRAVLLLHGFPECAEQWEHQLAALAAPRFDLVGHDWGSTVARMTAGAIRTACVA